MRLRRGACACVGVVGFAAAAAKAEERDIPIGIPPGAPSAPQAQVGPQAPAPAARVVGTRVTVDSSSPVRLESQPLSAGKKDPWQVECFSPCGKYVNPNLALRVAGDSIRNSSPFQLSSGAKDVTLSVNTASKAGFALGIVGTAVGGLAAVTGLALALTGFVLRHADRESDRLGNTMEDAGWITAGAGVLVTFAGVATLVGNARTKVEEIPGTPSMVRAREPRLPSVAFTVPVVAGAF